MKTKKPVISVVIPCYNSEKFIFDCLSSLFNQKFDYDYELIVVDSSKDSTPDIIRAKFPSVKLLHFNSKTLAGKARNIGVKAAKSSIIAFTDSDCIANPDWLKQAKEAIEGKYALVGGTVRNGTPFNLVGTADYLLGFNEFMQGTRKKEINFMPTCNLICKKEVFAKAGWFPEDLPSMEEIVFINKTKGKYKLLFEPKVIVYHINRTGFMQFLRHHYIFAKYSSSVRKQIKLPGSFLTRYPLLSLAAPFIRFFKIFFSIAGKNATDLFKFIIVSPLILIGLISWSVGFIIASFKK